ncbi:MAG: lysostaphin resistance A-like protein [Limisphaerales bacterium]
MLPPAPWRLEPLVLVLALLLLSVGALGTGLAVAAKQAGVAAENPPFWLVAGGTVAFHVPLAVMLGVLVRTHGIGWRAAFVLATPGWRRALAWGAASGLVVIPGALALQALSVLLLSRFGVEVNEQVAVTALRMHDAPWQLAILGVGAALLAPVTEEHFFRGVLYRAGLLRAPRVLAALLTSGLFALSHGNLPALLPLVALGLVWTWLYEHTGDLLAPVVSHALFNAVNLAMIVSGANAPPA